VMKKLILLFSVIGLCCFSGVSLAEAANVAVFNLRTVLQQTSQLKMVQGKLNNKFSKRNKAVLGQQKKLLADIAKLRSIPASNGTKRNDLQIKIINEDSALKAQRTLLQRDVVAARNKNLQDMMARIRGQAAKIAKSRGFQAVFSNVNVAYNANSIDITNDIIKALK